MKKTPVAVRVPTISDHTPAVGTRSLTYGGRSTMTTWKSRSTFPSAAALSTAPWRSSVDRRAGGAPPRCGFRLAIARPTCGVGLGQKRFPQDVRRPDCGDPGKTIPYREDETASDGWHNPAI